MSRVVFGIWNTLVFNRTSTIHMLVCLYNSCNRIFFSTICLFLFFAHIVTWMCMFTLIFLPLVVFSRNLRHFVWKTTSKTFFEFGKYIFNCFQPICVFMCVCDYVYCVCGTLQNTRILLAVEAQHIGYWHFESQWNFCLDRIRLIMKPVYQNFPIKLLCGRRIRTIAW